MPAGGPLDSDRGTWHDLIGISRKRARPVGSTSPRASGVQLTAVPLRVLQVDIVVPVRNEQHDLSPSIRRLVGYLRDSFPFTARVTIAYLDVDLSTEPISGTA